MGLLPGATTRGRLCHLPSNLHLPYGSLRKTCSGDKCKDNKNLSFHRQQLLAGIWEERRARGARREGAPLFAIRSSGDWSRAF